MVCEAVHDAQNIIARAHTIFTHYRQCSFQGHVQPAIRTHCILEDVYNPYIVFTMHLKWCVQAKHYVYSVFGKVFTPGHGVDSLSWRVYKLVDNVF